MGDRNIIYLFEECYKISIEPPFEYPKEVLFKELAVTQIPYFM